MSRSRRKNVDKKNGRLTTAGSRNGHEKHCRDPWCSCGGKSIRRLDSKQDRQAFKQGREDQVPGRKWV